MQCFFGFEKLEEPDAGLSGGAFGSYLPDDAILAVREWLDTVKFKKVAQASFFHTLHVSNVFLHGCCMVDEFSRCKAVNSLLTVFCPDVLLHGCCMVDDVSRCKAVNRLLTVSCPDVLLSAISAASVISITDGYHNGTVSQDGRMTTRDSRSSLSEVGVGPASSHPKAKKSRLSKSSSDIQ